MTGAQRLEVDRRVPFAPHAVFAVISSPRGHVAIDGSGMLTGSDDGQRRFTRVGETFVVQMFHASYGPYQIRNVIKVLDPPKAIEWRAYSLGGGHGLDFGYELRGTGVSTLVTSYCDWSAVPPEIQNRMTLPFIRADQLARTLVNLERILAAETA